MTFLEIDEELILWSGLKDTKLSVPLSNFIILLTLETFIATLFFRPLNIIIEILELTFSLYKIKESNTLIVFELPFISKFRIVAEINTLFSLPFKKRLSMFSLIWMVFSLPLRVRLQIWIITKLTLFFFWQKKKKLLFF